LWRMPVDTHEQWIDGCLLPDSLSSTIHALRTNEVLADFFGVTRGHAPCGPVRWRPILSVSQQNERRKCRKGRKPRILRKQGPFRGGREVAQTRRKLAETSCFAHGSISGADWRITSGNCGNPRQGPPDRYCEKLEGGAAGDRRRQATGDKVGKMVGVIPANAKVGGFIGPFC
jgi:hypothetical protein